MYQLNIVILDAGTVVRTIFHLFIWNIDRLCTTIKYFQLWFNKKVYCLRERDKDSNHPKKIRKPERREKEFAVERYYISSVIQTSTLVWLSRYCTKNFILRWMRFSGSWTFVSIYCTVSFTISTLLTEVM